MSGDADRLRDPHRVDAAGEEQSGVQAKASDHAESRAVARVLLEGPDDTAAEAAAGSGRHRAHAASFTSRRRSRSVRSTAPSHRSLNARARSVMTSSAVS